MHMYMSRYISLSPSRGPGERERSVPVYAHRTRGTGVLVGRRGSFKARPPTSGFGGNGYILFYFFSRKELGIICRGGGGFHFILFYSERGGWGVWVGGVVYQRGISFVSAHEKSNLQHAVMNLKNRIKMVCFLHSRTQRSPSSTFPQLPI